MATDNTNHQPSELDMLRADIKSTEHSRANRTFAIHAFCLSLAIALVVLTAGRHVEVIAPTLGLAPSIVERVADLLPESIKIVLLRLFRV